MSRILLLLSLLLTAPLQAHAQAPATVEAPARSGTLTRIVTNAAVYGTLYAVAFTLVQASSAALTVVAPASALGATLTFGIPAVMVVAMASLVPVVVNNVPPAVVDWMNREPAR